MMGRRQATPWTLGAVVAMGAGTAAAHIGNNFTTYLVGGLIDRFGFSAARMGVFSMAETLAYAAAMFLVAPRAGAISARHLGLLASALVIAAQGLSAGAASFALLLAGRLGTGLGFGLMNSAVNLAAGRMAQPARAISAGIACQTLLFAAINIGLPMVGARHGVAGMFLALTGLSAVLGVAALALPPGAGGGQAGAHTAAPITREGWLVLLAMGCFAAGSLAIWPFMERAAHAIGLPATQFGRYQSLATLVSAGGNAGLAALGGRVGRRHLLAGALLACGMACAALTTVGQAGIFGLALVVFNASWFIAYPLLLGLAYGCDGTGRLAVMTTATWLLSQSFGSLAAGFIADAAGAYTLVGPLGLAGCVLALAITRPLARRADAGLALAGRPREKVNDQHPGHDQSHAQQGGAI
jgi:predicted MFS family arabinose efflux permease